MNWVVQQIVLKSTEYDAIVFTNGIVILEEKTSVNTMKATWIINGVQAQELSAEKTLLLENNSLSSYYTASQIC